MPINAWIPGHVRIGINSNSVHYKHHHQVHSSSQVNPQFMLKYKMILIIPDINNVGSNCLPQIISELFLNMLGVKLGIRVHRVGCPTDCLYTREVLICLQHIIYLSINESLIVVAMLDGCASPSLNTLSITESSVLVVSNPQNAHQSFTTMPAPITSLPRFTVPAYLKITLKLSYQNSLWMNDDKNDNIYILETKKVVKLTNV